MTLEKMLQQKLSEWRPTGTGRHTLTIPDEGAGWTAHLTTERNDTLGCQVWELTLRRTTAAAPAADLQSWANRAAQRVTGLMEKLAVIEVDAARHEAQLRSEKPTTRGDLHSYYEVLLKGDREAQVRRFQANQQPGSHREQTAFVLTHETLGQLAADLTAAG